jgi:hypothetical protein
MNMAQAARGVGLEESEIDDGSHGNRHMPVILAPVLQSRDVATAYNVTLTNKRQCGFCFHLFTFLI